MDSVSGPSKEFAEVELFRKTPARFARNTKDMTAHITMVRNASQIATFLYFMFPFFARSQPTVEYAARQHPMDRKMKRTKRDCSIPAVDFQSFVPFGEKRKVRLQAEMKAVLRAAQGAQVINSELLLQNYRITCWPGLPFP